MVCDDVYEFHGVDRIQRIGSRSGIVVSLRQFNRKTMSLTDDTLYDLPEDMKTQTPIQNRYCFWCHRRGGAKTSVTVHYLNDDIRRNFDNTE